ncbi:MAG: hypothetical protein ABIP61_03485 [Burkholderiaceae bacterium]
MTASAKSRVCLFVIALLVLVIAAMGYKFIVAGSVHAGKDGRAVVELAPSERALVLKEMRAFVAGLQQISQALADEDMQAVAAAARAMGAAKAHDAPRGLLGKLPLPFKQLAFGVHGGFDAIAQSAANGGTPKQTLTQLAGVLQSCVACHAQYQLSPDAGAGALSAPPH